MVGLAVSLYVYRSNMVSLPSRPPSFTGTILKIGPSSIAVGERPAQIQTYAEILPTTQIVDGRVGSRWRVGKEALFPGLKVNLWQTSVQESYPSRSRVSHIEIITP
jgi:hypothetical protein